MRVWRRGGRGRGCACGAGTSWKKHSLCSVSWDDFRDAACKHLSGMNVWGMGMGGDRAGEEILHTSPHPLVE